MGELTPPKYHYDPSLAAAAIFASLFAVTAVGHSYLLWRVKTWYFLAFLAGVLFEVVGLAARAVNANESPNWSQGPFIIQTLLILLAPALFAASIYMILARLIRSLNAEQYSLVRTNWVTKTFVCGDVISFATQCIGGAMISGANTKSAINHGENIVLGGLGIQILFFGGFIAVISVFHYRILKQPTTTSLTTGRPWKQYILVLYLGSVLIMIRSLFRVAEFAAGQTSALQSTEVYLYCLDITLMFICTVIFIIWHPSRVVRPGDDKALTELREIEANGCEERLPSGTT